MMLRLRRYIYSFISIFSAMPLRRYGYCSSRDDIEFSASRSARRLSSARPTSRSCLLAFYTTPLTIYAFHRFLADIFATSVALCRQVFILLLTILCRFMPRSDGSLTLEITAIYEFNGSYYTTAEQFLARITSSPRADEDIFAEYFSFISYLIYLYCFR